MELFLISNSSLLFDSELENWYWNKAISDRSFWRFFGFSLFMRVDKCLIEFTGAIWFWFISKDLSSNTASKIFFLMVLRKNNHRCQQKKNSPYIFKFSINIEQFWDFCSKKKPNSNHKFAQSSSILSG